MVELPALRWNPSAVLKIITTSNDISCAGITLKGLPCGYDLGGEPKLQARHLLNLMSQKSPRDTLDSLPQLARLCLCQKNHQKQAMSVVTKWAALIESHVSNLERDDTRRTDRSVDKPVPNRRDLTIHEIIAELDALSIRQAELTSMLQDANASDPGSRWISPSQNIANLSSQTPPSDSESSKSGQGGRSGSPSRDGWRALLRRGKLPK
ncbi:hypothetical protein B0O99DRAFT_694408 [Bisporella sp. PMI_857]|nr:hypothetical protein B0O99DRAFT_694408 [Bisporella sp. PMI_857]